MASISSKKLAITPPFRYFGGKRSIASVVWDHFGTVSRYIEPFCGGMSVGLACPYYEQLNAETYNDKDGWLINFWRSVQRDPDTVWDYAQRPLSEVEALAWVRELASHNLVPNLESDVLFCRPDLAGIWLWIMNTKISNRTIDWDDIPDKITANEQPSGILSRMGREQGIEWLQALSKRLERCILLCGDWKRAVTPVRLRLYETTQTVTAVFLDPPYASYEYVYDQNAPVASDVLAWAKEHGTDPRLRIAVCGFTEHKELEEHGWFTVRWKPNGGFRNQKGKDVHETIWFSPHCIRVSR